MQLQPASDMSALLPRREAPLHAYLVLSDRPLPQSAFNNGNVVSVSNIPDLHGVNRLRMLAQMPPSKARAALSPREEQVLGLIANGYTRYQAAKSLGISHNTVAKHIQSIYSKLDVSSVAEATQQAIALGIVVV